MAPMLMRAVALFIPVCFAGIPGLDPTKMPPKTERQKRVVAAFLHGWRGYKAYCWGSDELLPVSRNCSSEFGGLGAQIIDAMDTLWMMGLQAEYREARRWVIKNFTAQLDIKVSVFEVCIRILGGLLSAYFLSDDKQLLRRAKDLGTRLLRAWREGPLPHELVNLKTGEVGERDVGLGSSLAEVGTLQLELSSLSMATGDLRFRIRSEHVMDLLGSVLVEEGGLLPIMLRPEPPLRWTNSRVTLGGRGDSFYEYLLKQWLMTNRTEERYRHWYQTFVGAVRNAFVGTSLPSNFTFVREVDSLNDIKSWIGPLAGKAWTTQDTSQATTIEPMTFIMQMQLMGDMQNKTTEPLAESDVEKNNSAPEDEDNKESNQQQEQQEGGGENNFLEELIRRTMEAVQAGTEENQIGSSPASDSTSDAIEIDIGANGPDGINQFTNAEDATMVGNQPVTELESPEIRQQQDAQQVTDPLELGTCPVEDAGIPWSVKTSEDVCGDEGAMEEAATAQQSSLNEQALKMLQQLFGGGGNDMQKRMVYVQIPRLQGEEICDLVEKLKSHRWDLLNGRIKVAVPKDSEVKVSAPLLETVAGMATQHLAPHCQAMGYLKMDHLACFLPGLLALGVLTNAAKDPEAELNLAERLAEGCAQMWLGTPLGLAAESVAWSVVPGRSDMKVLPEAAHSILRPETVESLWYLYVATGDRKYQDWGWSIFEAIERHCRVDTGGFCGIENVEELEAPRRRDRMETFLLSETFKYLFLLFGDPSLLDLTHVVFNTEAHPLPVFDSRLLR